VMHASSLFGTAPQGGEFHSTLWLLSQGRQGNLRAARLIKQNKLESAVLAKIQNKSDATNIRSYIQRVMERRAKVARQSLTGAEAVRLALNEFRQTPALGNALESGELSIEHAAHRIKELHERPECSTKTGADRNRPDVKSISAIPTVHMDAYVAEMQPSLAVKQIGSKRIPARGLRR